MRGLGVAECEQGLGAEMGAYEAENTRRGSGLASTKKAALDVGVVIDVKELECAYRIALLQHRTVEEKRAL